MKIIATVVLVLIAGILNFTNAQSERMEEICVDSGGREAYDNYKVSIMTYGNCSSAAVTEIREELRKCGDCNNGTIDTALTLYCSKVDILSNCITNFTGSVRTCLDTFADEFIDLIINSTTSILQFPCENRKLVQDLFNTTDRSCLPSKMEALTRCGEEFFLGSNQSSSTTPIPTLLAAETGPLKSEFDAEACSDIQNFEQCSVRALTGCEDQIFATALETLFKNLNQEIPCRSLPKLQKSVASTDSTAANVL